MDNEKLSDVPKMMIAAASVLVVIDHQQALMPIIHDYERVLREAAFLADIAKLLDIPVVGTEQNPDKLGPIDESIRRCCDVVVPKMHFDACADGLARSLARVSNQACREVVIAGCEAHVCLLQSALGLIDAGLNLWVVVSASGSRRPEDCEMAMQRLAKAGAQIVTTEMVAFEWLRTCQHPKFREVLAAIKARYATAPPSGRAILPASGRQASQQLPAADATLSAFGNRPGIASRSSQRRQS